MDVGSRMQLALDATHNSGITAQNCILPYEDAQLRETAKYFSDFSRDFLA